MANILTTWQALDLQRRVILVAGVVASLLVVLMIGRLAMAPSMALLYGGLDQKNAGEVVAALDQMGVASDVQGDSIYVPADERDRVRLALAQEGLPGQGQAGYELLDNLSGFGTTSEMFQAAYWRAKEGELARTILAVPGVREARVHIGAGARRPFARGDERATAAVTVRMAGSPLSERSALSIRFLTALAVPNLDPTDVAVIDAEQGVILRPGAERSLEVGNEQAERRAQALRLELEELLAVRVGDGNVRVSVTVETTKQTQTISERIIDPESQVPVSSETEEIESTSRGAEGAVTVASNLPDGDAAGAPGSESDRTESRESVAFQYSETRRDERIEAGAVKRLGVAVLINEVATVADDGTAVFASRTPEELAAIEELVKSAIAYDAERGDVVTIESLRFALSAEEAGAQPAAWYEQIAKDHGPTLLQILTLGVVAALIGLFVLRPILSAQGRDEDDELEQETLELEGAETSPALSAQQAAALNAGGEYGAIDAIDPATGLPTAALPNGAHIDTPEAARLAALQAGEAYAAIESDAGGSDKSLNDQLRDAVENRRAETIALLRHWLSNPEPSEERGAK